MDKNETSRRDFLKGCCRIAGAAAVAGAAGGLIFRPNGLGGLTARAADKVWQLNPSLCDSCKALVNPASRNADGWGRCATECVLKLSAVKAVNDFNKCGYCLICPAYHDVTSEKDEFGVPSKTVCPQNAILRKAVGEVDPYDPKNNYYMYTIDESLCNGCGICVTNCKPPMGNGSLRLEVRHNLCVDCNRCSIAQACPTTAFFRSSVTGQRPGYAPPPGQGKPS